MWSAAMNTPKRIDLTGNAPCSATVYKLQKLRCNLCQKIFTAATPDNIGDEKYDAASGAMIALLKYGSGLPFNHWKELTLFLRVPKAPLDNHYASYCTS